MYSILDETIPSFVAVESKLHKGLIFDYLLLPETKQHTAEMDHQTISSENGLSAKSLLTVLM